MLAGILLLGLGLRLIGLGYGLPHVYNPDEIAIMNRALALSNNHFNPQNFLYPSLYFYALFAWEGAFAVIARVVGLFDSFAAFERSYFVDPTWIFLAGRALTAVCGTATIWATWRLGVRVFDRTTGLVAALLLAVLPLAVRDAHYVKHDVPATLMVVLAHLALARAITAGAARVSWIIVGALTGLAVSTHYYAVFVALPVAIGALTVRPPRAAVRLLTWAAAAAVIAFAATSPFLLLHADLARQDIIANRQIVMDRVTGARGPFGSLGFYLHALPSLSGAGPIAELALLGALLPRLLNRVRVVVLLVFPIAFLLFIANTFPATRYLNPILPFVALLAAGAITYVQQLSRTVSIAGIVGAALLVGFTAFTSIEQDVFFRQTDTRTLALDWISREVPQTATIAVQPYSVPLRMSKPALVEALTAHLGSADRATIKFQKQLALDPYPAPSWRVIYLGAGGLDVDRIYVDPAAFQGGNGLAPLRNLAVEYVVLKKYNEPDASMTPLGAALERGARRVAVFSPYRADVPGDRLAAVAPFLHNTDARIDPALERPGPTIEIWKLD